MKLKILLKTLAAIFILNFSWEISQMFLYIDHVEGFFDFIFVHIKATLGDVLLFIFIYLLGVMFFRSSKWLFMEKISVYVFSALCGFILAVTVEKYALITGRWEYNSLMLIIPILKVGISPILQLTIIPPLIIRLINKKFLM